MNHYVPDFEMVDGDYALPSSSSRTKKSSMMEDDIMELLWQNGQVVTQSQSSHRSVLKKTPHQQMQSASSLASKFDQDAVIPANNPQSTARNIPQQQQLFMQEDEMASWLHYPLNDANFDDQEDLCAALLYSPNPVPPSSSTAAASSTTTVAAVASASRPLLPPAVMRPPVPPPRRREAVANFPLFSRQRGRTGDAPAQANPSGNRSFPPAVVRESTVVDSSVTPAICCEGATARSGPANSNATTNNEMPATCDASVTSSPGGSSASAEPPLPPPPPARHSGPSDQAPADGSWQKPPPDHDRKRKAPVDEDLDYHSEDTEFESANPKKQPQQRGSSSTKRSRAAEVHNLSERRRRDRINEKMKALQELIPRCNKSDKASMLDEAIEYLKSLQMQVQMMSMGCGMVPMMFPGMQQYMSPIGMGLGVGMGMEMGMNRPMVPFPNVLAGASLPTPAAAAAAAHLAQRFPVPAFHMPPVPTNPNRMQGAGPRDPMLNSAGVPNSNFSDPYQQYLSLQQMQLPVFQNQAAVHSNNGGKSSASQGTDNIENNR